MNSSLKITKIIRRHTSAYYLTAFNAIYILLIFSLQTVSVMQCFSITILALIFIIFPAIIKHFQEKIPAFLHFFNFVCIFLAAFLNLVLAIAQNLNPDFSGVEHQGKVVISIISINTIINTAVSLGVMIFEIHQKCKSIRRSSNSKSNKRRLKALKIEISASTNKRTNLADLPKTVLKQRSRDSRFQRGNDQSTSSSDTSFSVERSSKIQEIAGHSGVKG